MLRIGDKVRIKYRGDNFDKEALVINYRTQLIESRNTLVYETEVIKSEPRKYKDFYREEFLELLGYEKDYSVINWLSS